MARPETYSDDFVVAICSGKSRSKLQTGSERRAIVNYIVDRGGRATLKQIDDHFGYDIRNKVVALIKANWLCEGGK